jgi:hypothetical protein
MGFLEKTVVKVGYYSCQEVKGSQKSTEEVVSILVCHLEVVMGLKVEEEY